MNLTLFGYGPGVFWRSYNSDGSEHFFWMFQQKMLDDVWPKSKIALAVKKCASFSVTADNMIPHVFGGN